MAGTWVTHFSFRSGLLLLLLRRWVCGEPAWVLHMSTGPAFGFAQMTAAMRDDSECDRPVVDPPAAVLGFGETDRLANQRLADIDGAALPSDLAVVAHVPDRVLRPVIGLAQDAVETSRRGNVVLGRRVIAERLMRTLVVVN